MWRRISMTPGPWLELGGPTPEWHLGADPYIYRERIRVTNITQPSWWNGPLDYLADATDASTWGRDPSALNLVMWSAMIGCLRPSFWEQAREVLRPGALVITQKVRPEQEANQDGFRLIELSSHQDELPGTHFQMCYTMLHERTQ